MSSSPSLLIVVAIAGFLYAIFSWFASGSMVGSWTGAQRVEKRDYPQLYRLLENVAIAAGLEQTPELRLIEDPAPNAFAAGRNPKTAYVAVTTGIVQLMDERELEGVLAHEVSHIRNRDVRLMTLVAVLVGVIALLSDVLLRIAFFGGGKRGSNPILTIIAFASLLIAPIAGVVIQLAVSGAASSSPTRRLRRSRTTRRGWPSHCASSSSTRARSGTRAARRRTCTSRAR